MVCLRVLSSYLNFPSRRSPFYNNTAMEYIPTVESLDEIYEQDKVLEEGYVDVLFDSAVEMSPAAPLQLYA